MPDLFNWHPSGKQQGNNEEQNGIFCLGKVRNTKKQANRFYNALTKENSLQFHCQGEIQRIPLCMFTQKTVISQSSTQLIIYFDLQAWSINLKCHKITLLTSFAKTKPLWQQEWLMQEKKSQKENFKKKIVFLMQKHLNHKGSKK